MHEIYFKKFGKGIVNFSSVFFNGAAHIQHHYFFNLENFNGIKNPEWYLKSNEDPFKEILFFYDEIVGDYLNLNKKFLFLTGIDANSI